MTTRVTPRCARRALMLACLAALPATPAGAEFRLAVAWDEEGSGRAFVAALRGDAPEALADPPIEVGSDGLLRFAFGRLYHLSRATAELTQLRPAPWAALRSYAFDPHRELRDVTVVAPTTAYLSDRAGTALLRLDLESGATLEAVDLTPLGVAPEVLSPETMLAHEGRLYVQLRRPFGLGQISEVAVVDLATESLVDADPVEPGVQGIPLAGTEPRYKMQVVPGTRRLMLSATGALLDMGGIETIDLDSLQSEGIALGDFDALGVNDFGPFVMLDDDFGWFSGATSIVASSHLHSFQLSAPASGTAVGNEIFYNAPHVVFDAGADRIYWPIPGGVRFYDARSGVEEPGSPTLLPSVEPTDIEGMPLPPPIPTLPAPALALAAAVIVAARARR